MIQQIENFKNFCYNIYVINKGQKPTKVHGNIGSFIELEIKELRLTLLADKFATIEVFQVSSTKNLKLLKIYDIINI